MISILSIINLQQGFMINQDNFAFREAVGYLVRKTHQTSVALFAKHTQKLDITPVQFAVLCALAEMPLQDQTTLAQEVALDAATIGSVITRLEAKKWIKRSSDLADKRRRLLTITKTGLAVLQMANPKVVHVQVELLQSLNDTEKKLFLRLLKKLLYEQYDIDPGYIEPLQKKRLTK